jgi:hypothetical protein
LSHPSPVAAGNARQAAEAAATQGAGSGASSDMVHKGSGGGGGTLPPATQHPSWRTRCPPPTARPWASGATRARRHATRRGPPQDHHRPRRRRWCHGRRCTARQRTPSTPWPSATCGVGETVQPPALLAARTSMRNHRRGGQQACAPPPAAWRTRAAKSRRRGRATARGTGYPPNCGAHRRRTPRPAAPSGHRPPARVFAPYQQRRSGQRAWAPQAEQPQTRPRRATRPTAPATRQ